MIRLKELNPKNYQTTKEIHDNLVELCRRMNILRDAYGEPMIITSGLRSWEDQKKINPSAHKSKHLIGAACDVNDPYKDLWFFCMDNLDVVTMADLYMENRIPSDRHCHFQIFPPASKNRIFNR